MLARLLLVAFFATPAAAQPFSFVALGDTTYAIPADNPLYGGLIDAINAAQPAFSIHVGDTKGYGDCGRAFQESQLGFFNRFARPVFYTPGNNEWADCWKVNRGSADPTEILALMREVFWSKPESLGRERMPLVRESDELPAFAEFSENARWTSRGRDVCDLEPCRLAQQPGPARRKILARIRPSRTGQSRMGESELCGRPSRRESRRRAGVPLEPVRQGASIRRRTLRDRSSRRSPARRMPSTGRSSSFMGITTNSRSTAVDRSSTSTVRNVSHPNLTPPSGLRLAGHEGGSRQRRRGQAVGSSASTRLCAGKFGLDPQRRRIVTVDLPGAAP